VQEVCAPNGASKTSKILALSINISSLQDEEQFAFQRFRIPTNSCTHNERPLEFKVH
jgi:hypothetical protein